MAAAAASTTSPASLTGAWLFIAACLVSIITGVSHLAAHVRDNPPPQSETHKQMLDLARSYPIKVPGGTRTYDQLHTGFSWHFGISFLSLGGAGLALIPRARRDVSLLRTLGIISAVTMAAYVAISLVYFFILPTAFEGTTLALYVLSILASLRPRSSY